LTEEGATIGVQVQPNASQNKVVRLDDGVWHIKIAAPPVKGKANQELTKFLSGILGVSKNNVKIIKGATSRRKVIAIEKITQDLVTDKLRQLCTPAKKTYQQRELL